MNNSRCAPAPLPARPLVRSQASPSEAVAVTEIGGALRQLQAQFLQAAREAQERGDSGAAALFELSAIDVLQLHLKVHHRTGGSDAEFHSLA